MTDTLSIDLYAIHASASGTVAVVALTVLGLAVVWYLLIGRRRH